MSIQIEWVGLAEASVEDGRGVPSLIGVHQNVVVSPSLPIAGVKRVVPVIVSDGDLSNPVLVPGEMVTLRISVESPSGDVLAFVRNQAQLGPPKWNDVPISLMVFLEFGLEITEYGPHNVRVEAEIGDDVDVRTKLFYVVSPDDQMQRDS